MKSGKSWPDVRLSLDAETIEFIEREAARCSTTPACYIRGVLWHVRRLGFTPEESKMSSKEQRAIFARDPTLQGWRR